MPEARAVRDIGLVAIWGLFLAQLVVFWARRTW
jgi:hypothetical protein